MPEVTLAKAEAAEFGKRHERVQRRILRRRVSVTNDGIEKLVQFRRGFSGSVMNVPPSQDANQPQPAEHGAGALAGGARRDGLG
jgi:hypothetical protein